MSTATVTPPRTSTLALSSAWAVAIMVAGQFAMIAIVPVVLVLVGSLRDTRLRWGAIALATVYAIPLVLWAISANPAPSLSKSMPPALAALVVAVAIAVAGAHHLQRRQPSTS